MPVRIFIHGLESSNRGTKGAYFREQYPDMLVPHFEGNLEERMKTLRELLSGKSGIRLVGSSFGGMMGTIYAFENASSLTRLILLAPAIHMLEERMLKSGAVSIPTWIYHGTNDSVIPLASVDQVAKTIFTNLTFHRVDDDHFLHKTFKALRWDELLG
jgi:predicted esterase